MKLSANNILRIAFSLNFPLFVLEMLALMIFVSVAVISSVFGGIGVVITTKVFESFQSNLIKFFNSRREKTVPVFPLKQGSRDAAKPAA